MNAACSRRGRTVFHQMSRQLLAQLLFALRRYRCYPFAVEPLSGRFCPPDAACAAWPGFECPADSMAARRVAGSDSVLSQEALPTPLQLLAASYAKCAGGIPERGPAPTSTFLWPHWRPCRLTMQSGGAARLRDAPAGLLAISPCAADTGRSLLDEALGETVAHEAALDHAQAQAHAADGGGVVDDVAASGVVATA